MAGHAGDPPVDARVDDVVAPPKNHPRFPLVDGLRAIAAISVLIYHVNLFGSTDIHLVNRLIGGLSVSVPIFFLVSGFLLYRPFIAHRNGGPERLSIPGYSRNRALRIFPAYWLVLLVLAILPGIAAYNGQTTVWDLTLTNQIPLPGNTPCVVTANECALAQTWSLMVEVSFYVFLPIYAAIAAIAFKRLRLTAWAWLEILLLLVLGLIATVFAQTNLTSFDLSWISGTMIGHFLWLALGMGLAIASVRWGRHPRAHRVGDLGALWWALAFGIFLAIVFWITPRIGQGDIYLSLGMVLQGMVAFLLLLPAAFETPRLTLVNRFLSWSPVAWIGLISYGVFLWHFVIAQKLGHLGAGLSFVPLLAATIGLTIPIAAASYYGLERPILRFKRR